MSKYEMIARWIHSECDEPITEIEFLLRNSYDKTEELEEAYDGVFELKGEQKMTTKDLNNLIRWCCDTDGKQFAKDLYNGDGFINEYKSGKFRLMQDKTIHWIASLDNKNRERLVKAINKRGE